MARGSNKLTDTAARSATLKPGRHSDGGGVYLSVAPSGAKSWVFIWVKDGKKREMGMGAYPLVTLAKARKLAAGYREAVAEGRDPIAERDKQVVETNEHTFGEVADMLIASMESGWRNEKHRYQWRTTLGDVYCAAIRGRPISAIDTEAVLSVLTPIWSVKTETASRLRGRVEKVLDFAKARGWRTGENPAIWRGHLANVLPSPKQADSHFAALPYAEVPGFIARVRAAEAMASRCLEFTILTAARSGEARGAVWSEIDLHKATWTIPGKRMKAGKEHRVPLSGRALDILRPLYALRTGDHVFPGQKAGKPMSIMAMNMFLRRLKVDVTVHGFRSAFRDWCGNETSYPREVAEQALAHHVGDAVERAYRRGDALEKRRALMEAWAAYLAPAEGGNVVRLLTAAKS